MLRLFLLAVISIQWVPANGNWTTQIFKRHQVAEISGYQELHVQVDKANVLSVTHHEQILRPFGLLAINEFSVIQLSTERIFIVVETEVGQDEHAYKWASIDIKEYPEIRAAGTIFPTTNDLKIQIASGRLDDISIVLIDESMIIGNNKHLVFTFKHHCIANGVDGVIERSLHDDESLTRLLREVKGNNDEMLFVSKRSQSKE
jgi:hypothetical protein